jgi:hypothetical protein
VRRQQAQAYNNAIGGMQTISRILPLNGERGAPRSLGSVRTPGGSTAYRFALCDLALTLTPNGGGYLLPVVGGANVIKIGPQIFNALTTALKLLYDRCRLVGMSFHFIPVRSMTSPGVLVMYIDYRADTTIDTLAKAVRSQGAIEFSPWKNNVAIAWKAQGPDDYEYVASASTAGFNPTQAASFQVYGEGLDASVPIGYIHVSAIVEMTGRQTA